MNEEIKPGQLWRSKLNDHFYLIILRVNPSNLDLFDIIFVPEMRIGHRLRSTLQNYFKLIK
jgi:hypothetical protein